mgnify:CR=1 FL=1
MPALTGWHFCILNTTYLVAGATGVAGVAGVAAAGASVFAASGVFFEHVKPVVNASATNADKIIAVSDFVGRETQKIFDLNFSYSVVGNAVDTQMFQPKSVENDAPIILYFGTLIRKKGIFEIPHIFNKVVEQIPHAQLWLVGKDSFDIQTKSNSSWQLAKPMFTQQALKQVTYFGALPYQKMQEKEQ